LGPLIAIDMTSVFYASRLAARHMREHKYGGSLRSPDRRQGGCPNISAYSAAKAGVSASRRRLAKELSDVGVTMNCIAPAMTETPLLEGILRSTSAT